MGNKVSKSVLGSLRLGAIMVAMALMTAGQSWALAVAHGDVSTNLSGVWTIDPSVIIETTIDQQYVTFPNVSDPNGYAISDATFQYANAEAGVFKGLYVASASYTERYDISVTAGAGNVGADLVVSDFLKNLSLTPGPTEYGSSNLAASSSVWLEIWNLSLPDPVRVEITGVGNYSLSQPFAAGDTGYLKLEWLADASAEAVPEPSTFILVGAGLAGLALLRKKITA